MFGEITDPGQLTEHFRRSDFRIFPLERRFSGTLRAATYGRIAIVETAFRTKIMSEATVNAAGAGIMLVVDNPFEAPHNGEALRAGDVIVYGPGASHSEHGRGQVTLALGLPAAELERQLRALLGEEAPELAGRRYRIQLSAPAAGRLASVLQRPWECPVRETPPGASGPPADAGQDLLSAACALIAEAWPDRAGASGSRRQREQLFLAAREVIERSEGAIDLTSLCEHVGVCAEKMRLVFREFVGLPPMQYEKLHRLHRCRRRLEAADPQGANVKSVARRCGVKHLGRFAVEYRRLFGERPSETLRSR